MINLITDCLEIVPGFLKDYYALSEYHYRTEPIAPVTQIYKIRGTKETGTTFPDPLGVIIYRKPLPCIRGRTQATKGFFHDNLTKSERLKLVNKKIEYIARLIIDPRFQKLGLGSWLLRDSLERQTVPIVETLTPIDFTNKIFQKAGFRLVTMPAPVWYNRFVSALFSIGLTEQSFISPLFVQNCISKLKGKNADWFENEIRQFVHHFRHRSNMAPGIGRTKYFLCKIPYPQAYLIWLNPGAPNYRENPRNPHRKVGKRYKSRKKKHQINGTVAKKP